MYWIIWNSSVTALREEKTARPKPYSAQVQMCENGGHSVGHLIIRWTATLSCPLCESLHVSDCLSLLCPEPSEEDSDGSENQLDLDLSRKSRSLNLTRRNVRTILHVSNPNYEEGYN